MRKLLGLYPLLLSRLNEIKCSIAMVFLCVAYSGAQTPADCSNIRTDHADSSSAAWAGKLMGRGDVRMAVPPIDNDRYPHLAWPKAVQTADGTIVLAYLAGRFHGANGEHSPAVSVSTDNGKTFSKPHILREFSAETAYTDSGNLAIGLAEDGAVIILAMAYRGGQRNHIFGWRSTDNGASWEPVDTSELGPNKTGSTCGTIVQLPNHKLMVLGHYRKGSYPYEVGIWQSVSHDNGLTWESPEMVTNVNGGEPVLVRSGNRLLAFIRGRGAASTQQYVAVSDDFGETWRLELTRIGARMEHTSGLAHPFAMVSPTNKGELLAVTVERPLPGSVWLWRGDVETLDFKVDRQLMDIPYLPENVQPDFGYTWLLPLLDNKWLMFYYHGLRKGRNAIWVADFEL